MTTSGELVRRARSLAEELRTASPGFKRSTFLSLVEGCGGDLDELRRRIELAGAGSGGHLDRTGSFEAQLEALATVLRKQLGEAEGLTPREVESWLGWTARMLYVGEKLGGAKGPAASQGRKGSKGKSSGGGKGRSRLPGENTPSDRAPVKEGKFSLDGTGALADLKRQLDEREEENDA